jgi:nucleotide-binding universal stress UspA family protein
MERFRNILLFIHRKEDATALKYAVSLARNNDAKLKLLSVVKETTNYGPILPASVKNYNIHDILEKEKRENLERMIAPYEDTGVNITTKVLSGVPFLEVIREIIRKDHDLLITGVEGKGELKDMIFGSTTMHFMRKCPCPVWAIKPGPHNRVERVLAAVDPDPTHEENKKLNRQILEMASSLAEMHKSELHVVHVWDFHVRSVLIPKKAVDAMSNEVMNLHKSWYDELMHAHVPDLPSSQVHFIKGEAGPAIAKCAREKEVDLIIMGTLCRMGIPGMFIGNTAERVLYRADCSVLAVKPEKFISPVQAE